MSRNRNPVDLLAELDELGLDSEPSTTTPKPAPSSASPKPNVDDEDDPLADLTAQLAVKPAVSRPSTPRLSSSTTTSATGKSPKRAEHTPASSGANSGRSSEERARIGGNGSGSLPASGGVSSSGARTSGEARRSYHQSFTPVVVEDEQERAPERPIEKEKVYEAPKVEASAGGGGWWGSVFSAASAAVKQAETLAKEIRSNEEAQRWAEQVKGGVGHLQTFGTDLRTRALPTFTQLISHIAPPISAHERLAIHTTHDIHGYPSLDPLIYSTFSRIMSQVEGGDLLVIQRGTEQRPSTTRNRATSEPQGYRGSALGSGSGGWTDGPWWRDDVGQAGRSLGVVGGVREGTRLTRVSAESYAKEFFDVRGGVEAAAQKASETLSEANPVRSSDIFLAIQAISYPGDVELFADGDVRGEGQDGKAPAKDDDEDAEEELIVFAIYLHDPLHSLAFSGLSQPFPAKWASWLDASSNTEESGGLPDSIKEIISSGGVDPREWVAEWMEEVLSLAVGVVAQRYVARRMGVGEGGIGRGKRRVEEEDVGGEAARAI